MVLQPARAQGGLTLGPEEGELLSRIQTALLNTAAKAEIELRNGESFFREVWSRDKVSSPQVSKLLAKRPLASRNPTITFEGNSKVAVSSVAHHSNVGTSPSW
jgi:hypothetical protein